jgi:hypothetical protein
MTLEEAVCEYQEDGYEVTHVRHRARVVVLPRAS